MPRLHRTCLIFGPFRHPTGRVRRWVPLSHVTTWEKLLPFWNLAHFVSQSIKSLFVNFYNRHNWITVATRKFLDYIYLSISCQPMLRHIFFTELNRRWTTLLYYFLQLHFHRYLSILVWESERSRNMVKMFSVTCLSNSWKNFREELVTLVFVSFKCMCCSRYVNCHIGAWWPRGLHLACTFEAHFASISIL